MHLCSTKEPRILCKVNNNIPIRHRNSQLFLLYRSTKEQLHIQLADKYLLAKRITKILIYVVIAVTVSNVCYINNCYYLKQLVIILFQILYVSNCLLNTD